MNQIFGMCQKTLIYDVHYSYSTIFSEFLSELNIDFLSFCDNKISNYSNRLHHWIHLCFGKKMVC